MAHVRSSPESEDLTEQVLGRVGAAVDLPAGGQLDDVRRASAPVVLVLSGILFVEHELDRKRSAEVLAVGDVFSGPAPARVVALTEARLCLVRSLRQVTERQPQVGASLAAALLRQQRVQADLRTVAHMPRADDRVLTLLRLLADRFGDVRADGVHLPVPLTHMQIGKLIGAQRPTVTTALGDLADPGVLGRGPDGALVLAPA